MVKKQRFLHGKNYKFSCHFVQLYVHDKKASVRRPIKELLGFKRITLQPGQKMKVNIRLPAYELAFWDVTKQRFYVEAGEFDIMVGSSSADIRLRTTLHVSGGNVSAVPPLKK